MPDISDLRSSLTKKIDMSEYFGKDAYVMIKKLKKSSKKRIQLLSVDSTLSKIALNIVKDKGFDPKEKMDYVEIGKMYMELPADQRLEAENVAEKIENIYLIEGIDEVDHNLTENDKPLVLDVDFWEMFPEAAAFVIAKIKELNTSLTDYSLGESKESSLIM